MYSVTAGEIYSIALVFFNSGFKNYLTKQDTINLPIK
jgi:hypothetical protein